MEWTTEDGEGVWVWVALKDEVMDHGDILFANVERIRKLMHDAVRRLGINRWPYVRVRTDSALELLAQGAEE